MGGFIEPFMPSLAWPQDSTVFAGSSWEGSGSSFSLAGSSAQAMEFHLRNGSTPSTFMNGGGANGPAGGPVFPGGTVLSTPPAKLHVDEEDDLLLLQGGGGLDFAVDADAGTLASILGAPCPVSLTVTDSTPVSNESSGSEQSGAGLPQFLLGEEPAAWHPAPYTGIIPSMAGEETSQSFGLGDDLLHEAAAACAAPNGRNNTYQHHLAAPLLQLQDEAEFSSGKLLSFAPGQQIAPAIDTLQMNQKEFGGGLHHLDLSSLVVPGPRTPLAAQFNPTDGAKNGGGGGQNGAGGGGAPKQRVRARRGQATDPHSIAERLRREKISDRMKNLQELVPNSNKTDKASMLEEIIDYIKFLQLQTKVLSMSRLGATEAVVPLLAESQNESSGLLVSPISRSGEMQHGGGGEELLQDSAALEQEIAQLMENNMTAAMQYLQNRGLCLMPIALASAISTKKGTSSAAVRPHTGDGDSGDGGLKPLGSLKETKPKIY